MDEHQMSSARIPAGATITDRCHSFSFAHLWGGGVEEEMSWSVSQKDFLS